MFTGPKEYILKVSNLWGKAISGPVLAVISLVLLLIQQTITNETTTTGLLKWGAWLTLGMALYLVMVAQYKAWREQWLERKALADRIKGFPLLQPVGNALYTSLVPFQFNVRSKSGQMVVRQQNASVLQLKITNQPKVNSSEADGRRIRATVRFYDETGRELVTMDNARWADSTQQRDRDPSVDITSVLAVDFPIGITRPLDIAFKYIEEDECYASNDDNPLYLEFKKPDHLLPVGKVNVVAEIQGPFVRTIVKLSFENAGKGEGLRALEYSWENKF
jgi:hypothetical protein